jgi:hypothetical protein
MPREAIWDRTPYCPVCNVNVTCLVMSRQPFSHCTGDLGELWVPDRLQPCGHYVQFIGDWSAGSEPMRVVEVVRPLTLPAVGMFEAGWAQPKEVYAGSVTQPTQAKEDGNYARTV